jgi:arylsulfatase A-like enzyme
MNRRDFLKKTTAAIAGPLVLGGCVNSAKSGLTGRKRPNILFIMTDDHGTGALSCYGSGINETPNLDRIARQGMLLKNCFVTTSLCAPSRATILTGTYPHMNGQVDISGNFFDGSQPAFTTMLTQSGYQSAVVGKWHLHSIPYGFNHYSVLDDQGSYFDPEFIDKTEVGPVLIAEKGYSTDIIADKAINWIDRRDPQKPFVLLCHFKSPHYNWLPDKNHIGMYAEGDVDTPPTFDHEYRGPESERMTSRIEKVHELFKIETWSDMPRNLSPQQQKNWNYQRFIKDYLRCIASVDDNVGRILDYLDAQGIADNTIVVYTSDNGMLQADHGLVDKQLMQEESIHVPFIIRYPGHIPAGKSSDDIVLNCDYAPTLLDFCGLDVPGFMQGNSARTLLEGKTPVDWRTSFYYHYYAHYKRTNSLWGVRTKDMKLICYYREDGKDARQLFDLVQDPLEVNNLIDNPDYSVKLKQLERLISMYREQLGLTDELLDKIYSGQGAHNHIPLKQAAKDLKIQIQTNTQKWDTISKNIK